MALKGERKKNIHTTAPGDEAVCIWSHAIGCFMGVEEGGEWEEEGKCEAEAGTATEAGREGDGGPCVTNRMTRMRGPSRGKRDHPVPLNWEFQQL